MLLWCLPSSFGLIRLTVWQMSFEEFQDGHHGGHLGYRNGMILAILNLYVAPMPLIKFSSIWLMVWEEISFVEFQDGHRGSHLGHWNGMFIAILNLYVTVMPPIKFQLNPTYGLGGDVVWRISRWQSWQPTWIWERNDFSNSESPCCHNASH